VKKKCSWLALTIGLSLLVFSPSLVAASEPILPDFSVSANDITFSPSDYVHYGTNVAISATVHNNGICWIRLNEFLDYAGYDFSLDTTKLYTFEVEIRWKATVTAAGYIKIGFSFAGLTANASLSWHVTVDTDWSNSSSGVFPSVRIPVGQSDHTLRIVWVDPQISPANASLLLDWVKLSINEYDDFADLTPDTSTLFFEAETYNPSHSDGINEIYPSDVIAQFFDGDPASGGAKINGDQKFGDQNYVHDQLKNVSYVKNNGIGNAIVHWIAQPPGIHSIYVKVDPNNVVPESDEGNNKASSTIRVYATLTISVNVATVLPLTNPIPGLWNYVGGNAAVTTTPNPYYTFVGWQLDGSPYGSAKSVNVAMNVDHALQANFQQTVGGYEIPIDKFGLVAPYIGVASTIIAATGASIVYVKHVQRKKEKQ